MVKVTVKVQYFVESLSVVFFLCNWYLCNHTRCVYVLLLKSMPCTNKMVTTVTLWLSNSTTRHVELGCLLVEHQAQNQRVASSNLGRRFRRIFFLQNWLCVLTFILCPFHPCVTALACKRPQSFCQKCKWQVPPKHTYTLDPTKMESADYAIVQAQCGNLSENKLTRNSSGNTQPVISAHLAIVDQFWPKEWN